MMLHQTIFEIQLLELIQFKNSHTFLYEFLTLPQISSRSVNRPFTKQCCDRSYLQHIDLDLKSPKAKHLYQIVPFWYASAGCQANLVSMIRTLARYPWRDQTSLICHGSEPRRYDYVFTVPKFGQNSQNIFLVKVIRM